MNVNASFVRKVIYIALIAVLLLGVSRLGQPHVKEEADGEPTGGGILAELRSKSGLAQSRLGEIDPASETMKLATLGLRPAATMVLWIRADDYKMKKDFSKLRATLNQISRLQPNFIRVWEFQAHNQSYNVSVEFDDYKLRYHWVTRGIDYLLEGAKYNRNNPRLTWNMGWFLCNKIGIADEKKQFRRLFRQDYDLHKQLDTPETRMDEARGPDGNPDNWLAGKLWHLKGQRLVENLGVPIKGKSPLLFHSYPPMAQMNHCSASQTDGYFDYSQFRWRQAHDEWKAYGLRMIPHTRGYLLRLEDVDTAEAEVKRLETELDALAGDVREALIKERRAAMTSEELEFLDMPPEKATTGELMKEYTKAKEKAAVSYADVVERVDPSVRLRVQRLVSELISVQARARDIRAYRQQVNYDFWLTRAQIEQTDEVVKARKAVFEGDLRADQLDFGQAKEHYETGFAGLAKIIYGNEVLSTSTLQDDLIPSLKKYFSALKHLETDLSPEFPFLEFAQKKTLALPPIAKAAKPDEGKKEEEEKKSDEGKKDEPKAEEPKKEP